MTPQGVILYGPPASGKDTTTAELSLLDHRFKLFERLKAGPGRTAGYRITTEKHMAELSESGDLLYSNARYGALYGVDRGGLDTMVAAGRIPVLHLGQVAGITALLEYPVSWTTVLLWCSRETSRVRCERRRNSDVSARLAVWDETLADLIASDGSTWSLIVDTADHSTSATAALIAKAVANSGDAVSLSTALLSR